MLSKTNNRKLQNLEELQTSGSIERHLHPKLGPDLRRDLIGDTTESDVCAGVCVMRQHNHTLSALAPGNNHLGDGIAGGYSGDMDE